jgi:hypothetical protein
VKSVLAGVPVKLAEHKEVVLIKRQAEFIAASEALTAELSSSLRSKDEERMRAALQRLKRMQQQMVGGVEATRGAVDLIEAAEIHLHQIDQIASDLHSQMIAPSIPALTQCLARAKELNYRAKPVDDAQQLLQRLADAEAGLQAALAIGSQQGWNKASISTTRLDSAMAAAKGLLVITSDIRSLLQNAKLIQQLRNALQRERWEEVEGVIQEAERSDVLLSEVHRAADQLRFRQTVIACEARLMESLHSSSPDHSSLRSMVVELDKFDLPNLMHHVDFCAHAFETQKRAKKVLDELDARRSALEAALESRDAKEVRRALEQAKQLGINSPSVAAARHSLEMMDGCKESLRSALQNGRATPMAALRTGAIDPASIQIELLRDAVLSSAKVGRVTDSDLTALVEEAHIVLEVRQALVDANWGQLSQQVKLASAKKVRSAEIDFAAQHLQSVNKAKSAQDALEAALRSGFDTRWHPELIQVDGLSSALQQAACLDISTPEVERAVSQAAACKELRIAVKAENWDQVARIVATADAPMRAAPEYLSTVDKLAAVMAVKECGEQLREAVRCVNEEALRNGLIMADAADAGFGRKPWQVVSGAEAALSAARQLMDKLQNVKSQLEHAINLEHLDELHVAIEAAHAVGYTGPLVLEAEALHATVCGVEGEIRSALASAGVQPLELAVNAAAQKGLRSSSSLMLMNEAQVVLALRKSIQALSWDEMERALQMARQANVSCPEVFVAMEMLKSRESIQQCCEHLREGLTTGDQFLLTSAASQAEQMKLNEASREVADLLAMAKSALQQAKVTLPSATCAALHATCNKCLLPL